MSIPATTIPIALLTSLRPLVTTFPQPPGCAGDWYATTTDTGSSPTVLRSGWLAPGFASCQPDNQAPEYQVFSPGICPGQMTTADFNPTSYDDETLWIATCCQTGFAYVSGNCDICSSTMTTGTTVPGLLSRTTAYYVASVPMIHDPVFAVFLLAKICATSRARSRISSLALRSIIRTSTAPLSPRAAQPRLRQHPVAAHLASTSATPSTGSITSIRAPDQLTSSARSTAAASETNLPLSAIGGIGGGPPFRPALAIRTEATDELRPDRDTRTPVKQSQEGVECHNRGRRRRWCGRKILVLAGALYFFVRRRRRTRQINDTYRHAELDGTEKRQGSTAAELEGQSKPTAGLEVPIELAAHSYLEGLPEMDAHQWSKSEQHAPAMMETLQNHAVGAPAHDGGADKSTGVSSPSTHVLHGDTGEAPTGVVIADLESAPPPAKGDYVTESPDVGRPAGAASQIPYGSQCGRYRTEVAGGGRGEDTGTEAEDNGTEIWRTTGEITS